MQNPNAVDDPNYPSPDTENPADESNPKEESDAPPVKSDSPDTETTLLPESIFGHSPEVGDVCKFKVVASHSGEIEVEYVKESKDNSRQSEMEDAMSSGFASKSME